MAGHSDDGAPPRPGKGAPGKGAEVREFRAAGRGKKCPNCGAAVVTAYRPFCSKRCADLDLGRWLREDYRLPSEEPPDSGEEIGPESAPESGDGPPKHSA